MSDGKKRKKSSLAAVLRASIGRRLILANRERQRNDGVDQSHRRVEEARLIKFFSDLKKWHPELSNFTDVTSDHIEDWKERQARLVAARKRGVTDTVESRAATTVARDAGTIWAAFNHAWEEGLLSVEHGNPVARIKRPAAPPGIVYLTIDQCSELLEAAREYQGGRFHAPVSIALFAGLTAEEIRHLRWVDVDYGQLMIHVQGWGEWKPTGGKNRSVPMHDYLCELLEGGDRSDPLCFLNRHGRGFRKRTFSDAMEAIREVAELPLKCTWPVCRHTFASQLIREGVCISHVSMFLGIGVDRAEDNYGWLQPLSLHEEVNRFQVR